MFHRRQIGRWPSRALIRRTCPSPRSFLARKSKSWRWAQCVISPHLPRQWTWSHLSLNHVEPVQERRLEFSNKMSENDLILLFIHCFFLISVFMQELQHENIVALYDVQVRHLVLSEFCLLCGSFSAPHPSNLLRLPLIRIWVIPLTDCWVSLFSVSLDGAFDSETLCCSTVTLKLSHWYNQNNQWCLEAC